MISSVIVGLVLIYAAYLFPGNLPEIMLVGVGWFFFGRSMAEKAVTLVRVPSSSGEPEKISRNRQWAASLGMLTFSVGILTQQWHIAIMGIVYSYITAAAMWENFRARLPYLYDPWSEILPRPPTLMHAMVAISILVELGAILTAGAMQIFGKGSIATIQVVIYGVCAFVVSLFVSRFLSNRGVSSRDIWIWQSAEVQGALRKAPLLTVLAIGVAGGSLLGLFAHAYLALLHYIPSIAEMMRQSRMEMDKIPNLRLSYSIMAVAFAPLAEEYLFRGLLFRALDREWGGWKAIFGSAAFFIIYHPVLAWVPVGLLGIGNAWLFKKTGRLAPAVIMHTVYNLVVLS
jgi:membrane protease YdiL (CAAX protease family)